jgi:hypothetical protein
VPAPVLISVPADAASAMTSLNVCVAEGTSIEALPLNSIPLFAPIMLPPP